jgi:hypothetical protein
MIVKTIFTSTKPGVPLLVIEDMSNSNKSEKVVSMIPDVIPESSKSQEDNISESGISSSEFNHSEI